MEEFSYQFDFDFQEFFLMHNSFHSFTVFRPLYLNILSALFYNKNVADVIILNKYLQYLKSVINILSENLCEYITTTSVLFFNVHVKWREFEAILYLAGI